MERNMNYTVDDVEIGIHSLICHVLKRWRMLLLWIAIGLVVGFAFQTIRVNQGQLSEEQDDYEIQMTDYKLSYGAAEQAVINYQKMIEDNQKKLEDSVWLNLDSEHVWTEKTDYIIILDEAALTAYQNSAINPYLVIVNAYLAQLKGESIPEQERYELIGKKDVSFWNELVTVSNNSQIITVSITGESKEYVNKIGTYLRNRIEELVPMISEKIASHTISVYSFTEEESKDVSILSERQTINESIISYKDKLKTESSKLNSLLREGEPVRPGKHVIKMALLCGIIFGIVALACVIVKFFFQRTIHGTGFTQLYNVPLIGNVRVSPVRKNWVDRMIDRYHYRYLPDPEKEIDSIAAFLMAKIPEGKVVLHGNAPKEDLQMLTAALSARTGGRVIAVSEEQLFRNAGKIHEVRDSSGVILVERAGISRLADIVGDAGKIMANDIPVIGWIVTE